jgi:hypothetical protein
MNTENRVFAPRHRPPAQRANCAVTRRRYPHTPMRGLLLPSITLAGRTAAGLCSRPNRLLDLSERDLTVQLARRTGA